MKCDRCGFVPVGDGKQLDWGHIYCLSCNSIIHFNVFLPGCHMGRCSCGMVVEEKDDGATVWDRSGKVIVAFESDQHFSRSSVQAVIKELG